MTAALGLDIGLSGVRATVVDHQGRLFASASVADPVVVEDGRAEHDPERWWAGVEQAVRQVAEAGPVDVIAIGALGPAPFLVDSAGTPLTPALCFALDTRAEAEQARLGVGPDHALPKVEWLATWTPEAAFAVDVAGWIAWRLTGRPVMDGITRLQYVHERAASPVALPEGLGPREVVGSLTADVGLPLGTPVVAGTLDSYVDVVAAGCDRIGAGCVLLGSTLIVYGVVADEADVDGLELQPYPGPGFLLGGSTSSGGNVLDWARRIFGDAVADQTHVRVVPYLAGERTPVRDPEARGALVGVSLTTSPAEIHRAFVDALALAVLDHTERIARVAGVGGWRASGGGVHNRAWLQATADAIGAPLEPAPLAGEGAGPALFGLAALGVDITALPAGDPVRPDPERAAWFAEELPRYRARYDALKGVR
jgi:xylulokinase